jgi:hypothetical protein
VTDFSTLFGSSAVKSVQAVSASTTGGGTTNVTISSVNTAKTVIVGTINGGTAELTSATNVQLVDRQGGGTNAKIFVLEFV